MKQISYKRRRPLAALLSLTMLLSVLPNVGLAANNIDDMTALDALGIDTSQAPAGYDENDPSNPYGQDQTTLAIVDELLAIQGTSSSLYGHNSPMLGDESAILNGSPVKNTIAGENNSDDISTYYDGDQDQNGNGNYKHQGAWETSPYSVAIEGNFSASNEGQKKQTAVLYALPQKRELNYGHSDGTPYNQTLTLNLNVLSPTNGKHAQIAHQSGDNAMSKGDLYTDVIIRNGATVKPYPERMRQITSFKNIYTVMNHVKLTAGDFDGDGIDEIAVYSPYYSTSKENTAYAVYPSVIIYDLQKMDGDSYLDRSNWKESKIIRLERWSSEADSDVYDMCPNMVSLTAADFDKDGTDDLAISYGYYGSLGEKDTKSAVYLGGRAGEMLTQKKDLSLGNIFRAGLATGDVDGDGYNELVLGGSLKDTSDKIRYIGVYEWNGKDFALSQEAKIDIYQKDSNTNDYIYEVAKAAKNTRGGEYYYSSGIGSANVAVGKFNGISEPGCIYVDGLIVEMGDSGLTLSRMVDDQLNRNQANNAVKYNYMEWGARAVDLNGDGTAQLVVSRINTQQTNGNTAKSFSQYMDYLKELYSNPQSAAITSVVTGAASPQKIWTGSFSVPNTDNDTTILNYSKQHYYTYSDPEILAVLASPPYFKDLDQDEFETADPNSTSYGSSKGSGSGSSYSNSFHVGIYTSWEHEVKFLNTTLFSTEAEMEINNHFTWESEQLSSLEYSAEYATYAGQDTVVLYAVPVETYVYSAKVPVTDKNGKFERYDTQTMTVNIPHQPTIKTLTLEDYEAIAKDYAELPLVSDHLLTHTMGEPASYPSSVSQIPAASYLLTGQPTLVAPAMGEPAPSTSYGNAAQTRSIEMTQEKTNSFNYEIAIDTKAGAGAGGVRVGVTAGYSHGAGQIRVTTSGSSYSGTILDLPKSVQAYGYGFSWRLCAFPAQTPDGKIFPVVTYLVNEVSRPPLLPEDFSQIEEGTTQNQVSLRWMDTGTPAGYVLYRYFRSAGSADFYEVAYISASDPANYELVNGVRHFTYTDKNLSPDTEYQYRIQTISASSGSKSVPSEILTAYTNPEGKIPQVRISPETLTAYPDTPATLTAILENESALSGSKISYQWQKLEDDGRTWTNLTGSTAKQNALVLRNAGLDDAGYYRCRVTSQQDQTVVSSYTDKAEVQYAKQTAVLSGLTASGGKAKVKVSGQNTNSIPTGVVVFTLSGAGYSKELTAEIDSKGYAQVDLSASQGVYKLTATYNGSRVFGSASADTDSQNQPVFYVSGIASDASYLDIGTYTYGDQLNMHKYTIHTDGTATDEGEIDYTKADFGRMFTLTGSASREVVLRFADQGVDILSDTLPIWNAQYISSKDSSQDYYIMQDAVVNRFQAGYAAFAGTIVMYYDGDFYTFEVARKDASVTIDYSDLPASIPYKDAAALLGGKDGSIYSSSDCLKIAQDRTKFTGQAEFGGSAAKYGTDYDILFASSSNSNWHNIRDNSDPYVRLNYQDYYPLSGGMEYSPSLYRQVLTIHSTYSLDPALKYGFYDKNKNYGVYLNDGTWGNDPFVDNSSYMVSVADCYNFTIVPSSIQIIANTYDVQCTAEKVGTQTAGTVALKSPTSNLTSFPAGTTLVFSAEPYEGYAVDHWTVNGTVVPNNTTNRLTISQTPEGSDVHVFFKIQQNALTYAASPEGKGNAVSCTSAGTEIPSGSIPSQGANLSFTATPAEGWHFTGWEYFPEGASAQYPSENPFTVKMPAAGVRVYGKFARDTYKLTLGENLIAYDKDGKAITKLDEIVGDTAITVKPAPGYELAENAQWEVTGSESTAITGGVTFAMTADTQVTCSALSAGNYTVTLTQADNGKAEATETGKLAGGTKVTFTASPARGYSFAGWSDGANTISTENPYTVTVAGDLTLTPIFTAQTGRSIRLAAAQNGSLEWKMDGVSQDTYDRELTLYPGESVELTAVPDSGYMVAGWTKNGSYTNSADSADTTRSYSYESLSDSVLDIGVSFKAVMNYVVRFAEGITATADGSSIQSGSPVAAGSLVKFTYQNGTKFASQWLDGETQVCGASKTYTVKSLSGPLNISVKAQDGEVCTIRDNTSTYTKPYIANISYGYPLNGGGLKGTSATVSIQMDPEYQGRSIIKNITTTSDTPFSYDVSQNLWVWHTSKLTQDVTFKLNMDSPYPVILNDSEHGALKASPSEGFRGDTITLYAQADDGYQISSLTGRSYLISETADSSSFNLNDRLHTAPILYGLRGHTTLTAAFTALEEGAYTITFDANDGKTPTFTASTDTDGKLTLSELPTITRPGYALDGWYTAKDGGDVITLDQAFTEHTTVYAHWSDASTADTIYHVTTLTADGGSSVAYPAQAKAGEIIALAAQPEDGYALKSYVVTNTQGEKISVNADNTFTMPKGGATVRAVFGKIQGETFRIRLNANGGTVEIPTLRTDDNGKLSALPTPTRPDYVFDGWFTAKTDGQKVTENTVFTQDATIYAQWRKASEPAENTYTLTFNTNGGSSVDSLTKPENTVVDLSAYTSTKSGYTFTGWFSDEKLTQKITSIKLSQNTTIYAGWKQNTSSGGGGGGGGGGSASTTYTLTFNTNGGSNLSSISKASGTTIALGSYLPTKTGYTFTGWYSDAKLTEKITSVKLSQNTTVYAGWKATSETPEPDTKMPFTDVKPTDWFYDDVAYVFAHKLMQGTDSTAFTPNAPTTRGMMVTILYRLEGEPKILGSCPFDDVKTSSYYEKAITWAAANHVVQGVGQGKFNPDASLTREQMAAILYRYCQYKGYDVSVGEDTNILSYTDAPAIGEYAIPAMQWACGAGLIQGTSKTTLSPKGESTRAQIAAILHRFLVNVVK